MYKITEKIKINEGSGGGGGWFAACKLAGAGASYKLVNYVFLETPKFLT